MTKLTMPEPVQRDDTLHGVNYYTAEALRDVLEQAAKRIESPNHNAGDKRGA